LLQVDPNAAHAAACMSTDERTSTARRQLLRRRAVEDINRSFGVSWHIQAVSPIPVGLLALCVTVTVLHDHFRSSVPDPRQISISTLPNMMIMRGYRGITPRRARDLPPQFLKIEMMDEPHVIEGTKHDSLQCKICIESFSSSSRQLGLLACAHTFCTEAVFLSATNPACNCHHMLMCTDIRDPFGHDHLYTILQ